MPVTRLRRSLTVLWRLSPFLLAFLRDRRSWILFGAPPRRTLEHHTRRAERLTQLTGLLASDALEIQHLRSMRTTRRKGVFLFT